jgi:hypothetical protein
MSESSDERNDDQEVLSAQPEPETVEATRYVDMWALRSVHPTNIDLLQQLKTADDRQFGANMDVCGTISEKDLNTGDWEKTHIVGIRADAWEAAEDRRLVLKMFKSTSKNIRWQATAEELTTREIHNTIGSRRTVLTLVIILEGHEYMIHVQQNHRTFRIPSLFTFAFHDDKEDRTWYLCMKRKWISIGADFVLESGGKRIAVIDGKLISLGYNAHIHVFEPTLAKNRRFLDLLSIFAASVGYHRAVRRGIRRRVRAVKAGRPISHKVEDEEFWLLKNPRRRAA